MRALWFCQCHSTKPRSQINVLTPLCVCNTLDLTLIWWYRFLMVCYSPSLTLNTYLRNFQRVMQCGEHGSLSACLLGYAIE